MALCPARVLNVALIAVSTVALAVLGAGCGDNSAGPDAIGACSDHVDNDDDTLVDYPADPGCDGPNDGDESNSPIAQCADGRDNDADGLADYPADPGCFSALSDTEADDCPGGDGCPQCGNHLDDDGDGLTDFPDDLGCAAASDDEEYMTNPNACGPGLIVTRLDADDAIGTLVSGGPSILQSADCGGVGDEVAYELVLDEPTYLIATTDRPGTTANTVLYLRSDCTMPATEIVCNDDITGGTNLKSTIEASLPVGVYYLIVDNQALVSAGDFALHLDRFAGEGVACGETADCGPGLVCRVPLGGTEMVCAQPVCNDGLDDDGDGTPDYPGDPGCDAPTDATEEDDCPDGPNCPACANELDDDGDTFIDYPADTDCNSASQPVEGCASEQDPIFLLSTGTATDDLTTLSDDFDLSCDGASPQLDRVWFVTVPAMESLIFDTEASATDTAIALIPPTCTGAELGCDDDSGSSTGASRLELIDLAAGTYALVVENYGTGFPPGAYNLHLAGTIAPGGRCDGALATAGVIACGAAYTCGGGGTCIGNLACNNGVDDDGDTLVDFPVDPGCASPTDTDEMDDCPDGPGCPQCGNGLDDDGDGDTDYPDDTACEAASSGSESCSGELDPILTLTMPTTTGDVAGFSNDMNLTCGNMGGADQVLLLDVPALTSITFDTEGSAMPDTVLALLPPSCTGTSLGCDDDGGTGNLSLLTVSNLAAGSYALVVASYTSTTPGPYTLHVAGSIADGESCEGALAVAGVLTCGGTASCQGAPGSRTCQAAACADAIDQDGDGFPGYPSDPGCTSPGDNNENDTCPGGASCPQCGNEIDDDGDGQTDYPADLGCTSASGDETDCTAETSPILPITLPVTTGTTTGGTNDFTPECQTNSTAEDVTYSFAVPVALTTLTMDTEGSPFDTVLTIDDASCAAPAIECDDDDGTGVLSTITRTGVAPALYYLTVDGYLAQGGAFTLNVHGVAAADASCLSPLFAAGVLTCATGQTCTAGTCQ